MMVTANMSNYWAIIEQEATIHPDNSILQPYNQKAHRYSNIKNMLQ